MNYQPEVKKRDSSLHSLVLSYICNLCNSMNMICVRQLPRKWSMDSYLQSASALITFLDLNVYLRYILVAIFDNSPPQHSLFQITKCGFWGHFLVCFCVCLFGFFYTIAFLEMKPISTSVLIPPTLRYRFSILCEKVQVPGFSIFVFLFFCAWITFNEKCINSSR